MPFNPSFFHAENTSEAVTKGLFVACIFALVVCWRCFFRQLPNTPDELMEVKSIGEHEASNLPRRTL